MSNAPFPLDGLTIAEKLTLMERIWADLERRPAEIPVPQWHGDVLAKRLASVEKGDVDFLNWDDVKDRLQRRFK